MAGTTRRLEPFLSQVARAYLEHDRQGLADCCFVFPNKRSGTFFRRYLVSLGAGSPLVMPEITTIGQLAASFTPLTEASRIEQLFTLYDCYRSLAGGEEADFDHFMFWGEMILSDFNDVDLYLVDPDKLFVNLKRYREISADYLTDVQKEILSRYWGEAFAPQSPEVFWNHLHADKPTDLEKRFLRLWEVLAPLYHSYTDTLLSAGHATSGMMMRRALDAIRDTPAGGLPFGRYVFVGHNVLTLSEISIMETLQRRDVADFYWDHASPVMKDAGNAAARFIARNVRKFPSRFDLSALYPDQTDPPIPDIALQGVPSAVAQARMAGLQLQEWIDEGVIDPADFSDTDDVSQAKAGRGAAAVPDTAVVLPDESLLIPMAHSVPEAIRKLNITMGLPMRTTSFASLVSLLVAMQLHATQSKGEWCYFHEDVRSVITHPLVSAVHPADCESLMRLFMERRIYLLPAAEATATAPGLAYIFTPIANTDSVEDVYVYFRTFLTTLAGHLAAMPDADIDREADRVADEGNGEVDDGLTEGQEESHDAVSGSRRVELFFINAYLEGLDQLHDACRRWKVTLKDSTFIQLLQKTMAGVSVSLKGEPLSGLQIMGVLETRVLDFDNLIILSMNERIFPRKHYTRSFIPDSLRRSYGMATTDFQESIYAYYFYRLISRARRVSIFYDSRNGPTYTSEISRYLIQLMYLHPECKVTHTLGSYELRPASLITIKVPRTPEIRRQLKTYCTPGGKALSASAINEYINCPLQFYLKHLWGLNTDNETTDYMDSATYGSIVHNVAQKVYLGWRGDAPSVTVTARMLDDITAPHSPLDGIITETVNELFNRRQSGDRTPLTGEARVMGNLIRYFLERMFRFEKTYAPFDFIDAEHLITGTMKLAPDLTINIKQYLDRIDRVYPAGGHGDPMRGTIRIVDYKTGTDELKFKDMNDLFDPASPERRKAILQLLFYSRAYAEKFHYDGPIQPFIYRLRKIVTEGLSPLKYGSGELTDYREVIDAYMDWLEAVVRSMLLGDSPFAQADSPDHCTFCRFTDLCRRNT